MRNYVISVVGEGRRVRCGMGTWAECRVEAAGLVPSARVHVAEFGALTRNPAAPALYAGPAGEMPASCPDPLDAVDQAIDAAIDAMDADAPDMDALSDALRGALAAVEKAKAGGPYEVELRAPHGWARAFGPGTWSEARAWASAPLRPTARIRVVRPASTGDGRVALAYFGPACEMPESEPSAGPIVEARAADPRVG